MAITLGAITLDPRQTQVREVLEEVGGRDRRRIHIDGLLTGSASREALEAEIDAILAAGSAPGYTVPLSLRPGRRMLVRREGFTRRIALDQLAAAYSLELAAPNPYEEAETETVEAWPISTAPAAIALSAGGNVQAPPVVTLEAQADIVNPALSDGTHTLAYLGTIPNGSVWLVDAAAGRVYLDGVDVTAYTHGGFPQLAPTGTTLVFNADGSPMAAGEVRWRDRWW